MANSFWKFQLTDEVRRGEWGHRPAGVAFKGGAFEDIEQRAVKSFSLDCEMILTGTT